MNKNTVLVIMPIYNAEETLSLAIESILKQDHADLKLVLVDDASTDNSLEIARTYLKDNRVSLYKNNINMGAYYCRNVGLEVNKNSEWSFFTTHDSDDISYKNRFTMLLKILNNKDVNGVQDVFERRDLISKKRISRSLTIAHAIFKRSVFDNIGYFEKVRFGADWEHWARLTEYNKINKKTTRAYMGLSGQSFVHKNNLTVLIPIDSTERKEYIASSRSMHKSMIVANNFYRYFSLDKKITKKVV